MGLASFRLLGSSVSQLLGRPTSDRRAGPPLYADPGQRLFVDLTDVLRSRVGRSLMPRVLDVMEARSAVVLRGLLGEPDLSLTQRSPLPFIKRVSRIALLHGVPLQVAQALASPAATHRRLARLRASQGRRLTAPQPRDPHARLEWVERVLAEDAAPLLPRDDAARRHRTGPARARRPGCWVLTQPAPSWRRCCAGCRTTSPPRWTWRSGGWLRT